MRTRGWIAGVAVVLLAAGGGWWAGARTGLPGGMGTDSAGEEACPGGAEPLYWKAPMDPSYVREEPGKSPMGMDLVPVCPGEEGAPEPGVVRIDPVVMQNMGVRTAPVERRDLARKIRAVGRVDYDERRVSMVHTKVQGWVERLHVQYEGEAVRRGQPLLEIYSPQLVATQEELLVAARYRDATAGSPFADVSEGGDSLLEATRRRLELWDIPERDIRRLLERGEVRKTLTLYAPTSGVVTELSVREGREVGPQQALYTISALDEVWIYADVYEYELPWIAEGQPAVAELSYLPGRRFEGRVDYVYPFLEERTRTARVRMVVENPDGGLKPDMYADVTIHADPKPDAVAVPSESVIRSGRRNLVVLALGDGRFRPREVELGVQTGDGWTEIRSGASPGERVVTSGQFLIDSESKLREAVQKMLEPESGKGATPSPEHEGEGHAGHGDRGDVVPAEPAQPEE